MSIFDDFISSIPVVGGPLESIFGENAGGGDTRFDAVHQYQNLLGQLPTYQPLATKDVINSAAGPANDIAKGREQAALQDAAARGGGSAQSGNVLAAQELGRQGSMNRLGQVGYQAKVADWSAINQFNQQNIMNKLAITHGMTGQMDNLANYQDRQSDQRRQQWANFWNPLQQFMRGGGNSGGGSAAGVDQAWQGVNEAGGLPMFPGMGI